MLSLPLSELALCSPLCQTWLFLMCRFRFERVCSGWLRIWVFGFFFMICHWETEFFFDCILCVMYEIWCMDVFMYGVWRVTTDTQSKMKVLVVHTSHNKKLNTLITCFGRCHVFLYVSFSIILYCSALNADLPNKIMRERNGKKNIVYYGEREREKYHTA